MGTLAMLGVSVALGLVGGLLVVLSGRVRLAVWVALIPLAGVAWIAPPLPAAAAGLAFGGVAAMPGVWRRIPFSRRFEWIAITASAVGFAAVMAGAAWLWPDRRPAWGLVVFPLAMLLVNGAAERSSGRLANSVLMMAQRYLTLVHVARLGHDQVVTALLATWSVVPIVLLADSPLRAATVVAAVVAAAVVAAGLAFGRLGLARTVRAADAADRLRVAAVATDLDAAGELPGQDARGRLAEVIGAYEPLVGRAIEQGARVVVLPENAAWVSTAAEKTAWLESLGGWARRGQATVVAGLFDEAANRNQVAVLGADGNLLASYDKRHPFGAGESAGRGSQGPATIAEPVRLSAAICYDLDFNDLVRPVRRCGGLLAAPTNDWAEYAAFHRQAAIWVPVLTGTTLIRAASHGIAAIIDPAGRTLAEASTFDGPVVLVADVPAGQKRSRPARGERLSLAGST